jgi:hypothetical protein
MPRSISPLVCSSSQAFKTPCWRSTFSARKPAPCRYPRYLSSCASPPFSSPLPPLLLWPRPAPSRSVRAKSSHALATVNRDAAAEVFGEHEGFNVLSSMLILCADGSHHTWSIAYILYQIMKVCALLFAQRAQVYKCLPSSQRLPCSP